MGSVSPSVNAEAETLLLFSAAAALARNRAIAQQQETLAKSLCLW